MNGRPDVPERDRPAFLVGITGSMHIDDAEVEPLKHRVRRLFCFLKDGPYGPDDSVPGQKATLLDSLVRELVPDTPVASTLSTREKRKVRRERAKLRRVYRRSLSQWQPLRNTPVAVLSSLAPGADSIVAEVALEPQFSNLEVCAPLPFPHQGADGRHVYRRASTFVRSMAQPGDPADAVRQKDYDALVARMTPEKTFHVLLEEDLRLSPGELDQRLEADLQDPERRRFRYYAAGEFIAVHAHLLLAIWNGEAGPGPAAELSRSVADASTGSPRRQPAGTAAVVEARLRGPRQGVLPLSQGLSLPHGGPLVHVFARKADADPAADATPKAGESPGNATATGATSNAETARRDVATPSDAAPPVRFLHPPVYRGKEQRSTGSLEQLLDYQLFDTRLQADRLAMFCRIGSNLELFNSSARRSAAACEDEFKKRLTYSEASGAKHEFSEVLDTTSADVLALRDISDLRRTSADLNRPLQRDAKRTLGALFWMTFLAATLLHAFAHWHPQVTAGPETPAVTTAHHGEEHGPTQVEHSSRVQEEHVSHSPVIKWGSGLLALSLAALALVYFACKHAQQFAERAHDYRALAEGLRVQFYWDLVGIGRCVSSGYMQRQMSELDWIRGAIRSVALTSEQRHAWFDQLDRGAQIAALHCAEQAWIHDQLEYFERELGSNHYKLHVWHRLGGVAALAGIWIFAALVAGEIRDSLHSWIVDRREYVLYFAAVMLVVAVLTAWFVRLLQPSSHGSAHRAAPSEKQRPGGKLWSRVRESVRKAVVLVKRPWALVVRFAAWILGCVYFLVPHRAMASAGPTGPGALFFGKAAGFVAFLPLSLAVSGIALWLCLALSSLTPAIPPVHDLGIIAGGVLLLSGALAVAWAEKNLFSEHSYQYNTMAGVFRSAAQRIDLDLQRLEHAKDDVEQERIVREVQNFLFAIGKEALDENAEWLLLHRARPLEPVMAG